MKNCDAYVLVRCVGLIALVVVMSALALTSSTSSIAADVTSATAKSIPVRLAVLGDSDTHAYQNDVTFPPSTTRLGGYYRPQSA